MVDAVHDEQRDERNEREPADLLRPPAPPRHGREHFVDRLFGLEGRLVLAGRVEDVVAVEAVGQFLRHEVPEQQSSRVRSARPRESAPGRASRRRGCAR